MTVNVGELLTALNFGAASYSDIPSTKHPKGRTYVVPSPPHPVALQLRAAFIAMRKVAGGVKLTPEERHVAEWLDDDAARIPEILGPAYDEMVADGVPGLAIDLTYQLAIARFGGAAEVEQIVYDNLLGKGQAATADPRPPSPKRTGTQPRKAGSKSTRASGPTQARTQRPAAKTPTSGRSSTSPTESATKKAS